MYCIKAPSADAEGEFALIPMFSTLTTENFLRIKFSVVLISNEDLSLGVIRASKLLFKNSESEDSFLYSSLIKSSLG